MSTNVGQPAPKARSAISGKGVLITAGIAIAAVAATYAFTAPASAVGSTVVTAFPTSATPVSANVQLSASGLDGLLHSRFAPVASIVIGQGNTAAQQTTSLIGDGSGVLSSGGNILTVNVPAIANIGGSVTSALAPISSGMGELSGSNGQVANAVNGQLLNISPLLNLNGSHAAVTANIPIDLDAAVAPDINGTTGSGAVTLDPNAGTVTINLADLLGNGVTQTNGGSVTLSPAADAEISADINSAASALGNNIVNSATSSVENTPVNVDANVHLLSPSTSGGGATTCTSTPSTGSTTSTTSNGLLGGLVQGVLGGVVSTVTGTVNNVLCTVANLVPALLTTLNLNLGGTVNQVASGTPPTDSGSLSMLGQPTPMNMGGIDNGVANAILNNFSGNTGSGGSGGSGSGSGGGVTTSGGSQSNPSGGSSDACATGTLLALCLNGNVNANGGGDGLLGDNGLDGLNLGGLNLGGLGLGTALSNGGTGTGITPGILGSLLTNNDGGNLPIGISVNAGNGESTSSGSGSSGGSSLININGSGSGNVVPGVVNVGNSTGSGSSSGSSGSTGSGNGILGLHLGTGGSSGSGGSTSGNGSLLNLGL